MNLNGNFSNPGEMRTLITLQKRNTISQDAGGFKVPSYSDLASVWSKWVNLHGSEVFAASAAGVKEGATVLIRYRSDVDDTGRVVKGGQVYEILSMDNIQERNEYIELKVAKVSPA
jgi:SPP1 family predicted phage head-tail adaptor